MDEARWLALWAHRDDLLRIARRRTRSDADAEDCVHEAIVRAVAHPDLDDERAGAFLTAVTVRLCTDLHRRHARLERAAPRLAAPPAADPQVAACERADLARLRHRHGPLTERERATLLAYADGWRRDETALLLGTTGRAVDAALSRARGKARRYLR